MASMCIQALPIINTLIHVCVLDLLYVENNISTNYSMNLRVRPHYMIMNGKCLIDNQVERISANSRTDSGPDGINMYPFSCVEITKTVATLPNGKAYGVDLIS